MDNQDIEYKSKSQYKREADALQKLGEELMNTPLPKLRRMDLPTDLMAALEEGQTITSNVARRRHRQYIGALMRDVDPIPIRHALACTDEMVPEVDPVAQKLDDWLNRMLAGENSAIEDCLEKCPELDRQRLRQLLRNIQKQGAAKKKNKSRQTLVEILRGHLD